MQVYQRTCRLLERPMKTWPRLQRFPWLPVWDHTPCVTLPFLSNTWKQQEQEIQSTCLSWSVCLPACLSTCLSLYLSVSLPVCLPTRLSTHPSVYPPVCLSTHPSVYPSVCLPICMSTHLSLYLSVSPCVYLQCAHGEAPHVIPEDQSALWAGGGDGGRGQVAGVAIVPVRAVSTQIPALHAGPG